MAYYGLWIMDCYGEICESFHVWLIGEQSQKQAMCGDFVTMMSILIGGYRTLAAKATEQWLKSGG